MVRTRGRVAAVAAVVVLLAFLALAIPTYVFPAAADPAEVSPADVVYVIGPPADERVDKARELLDAGVADTLMISIDPEEYGDWELAASACLDGLPGVTVLCAKPDPFTTRGEGRWLRTEAQARGWESAVVITFTPHISRARAIVAQCFDGELTMVDSHQRVDPHYWAYMFAYQSGAYAKMWLLGGCGEGSGLSDAGVVELSR